MRSLVLSLLLFPAIARSQVIPFTSPDASMQENLEWLANQAKQNKEAILAVSTRTGVAYLASTQTFSGANTFISTITLSLVASTGVSTPTANSLYASGLNQAFVVFVTSNSTAEVQYSVGVTSVTYVAEGRYVITWQRPFSNLFYHRSITSEVVGGAVTICTVNSDYALVTTHTSVACSNQGPGYSNPPKVFVMATGAQ